MTGHHLSTTRHDL